MDNRVCLAVSNCKDCWDKNSKLAFISDSIPDYLDAEELKQIDPIVLDGTWKSQEYQRKSHQFVIERTTRYRNELLPILNSALDLDYSERAWGIILDSWLLHFTSVVYDRVNKLDNAQEQLGGVFLKCFNEDTQPILTTNDFIRICLNDKFNQQLFCNVAKAMGIEVKYHTYSSKEDDIPQINNAKESIKVKAYSLASLILRRWIKHQRPLVIADSYFPRKNAISILIRSLGKVLIIPSRMFLGKLSAYKKNTSLRNSLQVAGNDKYDIVANQLFSLYFPISLLEGLKNYSEEVSMLEEIPVLGAAGGFYYNEEFKILASRLIENGNKIIGFQHGGNYNFNKEIFRCSEYFEKLNSDKFYHWKEISISGKFLPTTKLEKLSPYKVKRKRRKIFTDILFVSTSALRSITRHEYERCNFLTKIDDQQKFYLKLNKEVVKHFLLRPYPSDFGWRYNERWLDFTKGKVRFDSTKDFYNSLVLCKIFVSDHISTTWLEAFYLKIPVILFFDLNQYFVGDEVKGLFNELQTAGIYHPTAESAASFLNEQYETIEDWWGMPETKAAADKIKDYFFTPGGNFSKDWSQELVALRKKTLKDKLPPKIQ